jgi:alkanesulfonate monooxygenase SsuD/methylene tetrahydromethanopterin reductase-like flavin-dependent oxidoreductase (luciferase family)
VILHPFLTPHGVTRSTAIVRKAAEEAGRDPNSVRIIAAVVVAPDLTADETKAAVYARASTYFVHKVMAAPILEANEWDVNRLDPILALGLENLEMQQISLEELRSKMAAASALIPPEWISEGASVGSAATVAARLKEYRAAGAGEILLHGASADKLEGLVKAYLTLP